VTTAVREALMTREHWAFELMLDQLVCVNRSGFANGDDVAALLRDLQAIAASCAFRRLLPSVHFEFPLRAS
jgi:hypothetical protein